MTHKLKLWPQFFERTLANEKMFEIRNNDRGFQKGDTVILQEYDPEQISTTPSQKLPPGFTTPNQYDKGYTGRELTFKIGYVMAISAEQCVFSLVEKDLEY